MANKLTQAKIERHYKAGLSFAPDAPKKQLAPDCDPIEDEDLWTQI